MNVQPIKQRFGIIGSSPGLDRAISNVAQVAPTDLSVLIQGESGSGKEVLPQVLHAYSARKHGPYIAVNCGAIPEGTIDSELFGHEKGSFTGAHEARKGYFEVANGGTIFLDEVGELPLTTQVRLLRVLETGEFIRVGSSKAQKTNVRVVAATNVQMLQAVAKGTFREDLYYRLNTVPIQVPPLRERKEDIHLLFRYFAQEAAARYKAPPLTLTEEAQRMLIAYRWPGNIRQLRNLVEQMSVIEQTREVDVKTLRDYLPEESTALVPASAGGGIESISERGAHLQVPVRHEERPERPERAGALAGGRTAHARCDHAAGIPRRAVHPSTCASAGHREHPHARGNGPARGHRPYRSGREPEPGGEGKGDDPEGAGETPQPPEERRAGTGDQ